ncbi:MAG: iron chelate uptake ABC transporter family permease subunit [Gordonia sp. (in: high G+C Gram-positive bacteria)]|uniref:FecCD family ABC transporter permease n=1 Tax=Gordonia sp. (in: high G+C Gram-positive bacteria) TaxID=84139 RepID=UPI0039E29CC2
MTTAVRGAESAKPARDQPSPGLAQTNARRTLGWLVLLAVLVGVMFLSVLIGSEDLPFSTVWDGLVHFDALVVEHNFVRARVSRTVLGVLVGLALGVAGALIQAMTRNPLADPGILGVNAGAAFFVALAVGVFGLTTIWTNIWFAFLGAIVATALVYLVGSRGVAGSTPVRLTLAGVAIGALLGGVTVGLVLLDPVAFDQMRAWNAGSIAGRPLDVPTAVLPFILLGVLLSAFVARPLNAVALGDDLARSLGADVLRTRVIGIVAVTLLCGAATAAAGPIGFIGLMIPHVCRWIVGPDQRWILLYTLVSAPLLLLASDILGRVILADSEVPVGVVTAFLGAPVLIALVRRSKASGL